MVRHLRAAAGALAEVARDWARLFPRLPHQSEANRRIRRLWGAFEQLRRCLADLPAATPLHPQSRPCERACLLPAAPS